MSDPNFWKDQYSHTWQRASARETAIIERIKRETGRAVSPCGLGAGSDEYLSGTAASRGYEKGSADLQVLGTNIYLEVTGPQSKAVVLTAPLWIRPDKLQNARTHYPDHETWVIHWLERDGTLRVICLDGEFFRLLEKGAFKTATPLIRGARETYIEIPANSSFVQPWSALIARLSELD